MEGWQGVLCDIYFCGRSDRGKKLKKQTKPQQIVQNLGVKIRRETSKQAKKQGNWPVLACNGKHDGLKKKRDENIQLPDENRFNYTFHLSFRRNLNDKMRYQNKIIHMREKMENPFSFISTEIDSNDKAGKKNYGYTAYI